MIAAIIALLLTMQFMFVLHWSSQPTIENMFNIIYIAAREARRNNPNFDGRAFWQYIKLWALELEQNNQMPNGEWVPSLITNERYQDILALEYDSDGNIRDWAHFEAQLHRLRMENDPSLSRILQVAFNLGQLHGATNLSTIADVGRFVSVHGQRTMNSHVTQKMLNQLYDVIATAKVAAIAAIQ